MVKIKVKEVYETLLGYNLLKDSKASECYKVGCKRKNYGISIKNNNVIKIRGELGFGTLGGDRISCKEHKTDKHVEQYKICSFVDCKKRTNIFISDMRIGFFLWKNILQDHSIKDVFFTTVVYQLVTIKASIVRNMLLIKHRTRLRLID